MLWFEELDKWCADYLPDMPLLREEPLAKHCSFRVGGPARRLALPRYSEQLVLLENQARLLGARPLVLGNGTNVLFPDSGLERLVISTREMDAVAPGENPGEITAQAGASLTKAAMFAAKNALSGLEFAHGIPGSVGGGVAMNAGAYGGELKDVLRSVTVLCPEEGICHYDVAQMRFGYRHSLLTGKPEAIVLSAVFALQKGDEAAIRRSMEELMEKRRSSQPLELPSAGSTFKRPQGHFAGALIEQTGCKGLSVGGAQVSPKHAGFLVNVGNATAQDILQLIQLVQKRVLEATGVMLEPEVRIIKE